MCKLYLCEVCALIHVHGHINIFHTILVLHIKHLLIQPHPLQAMCPYLRIISLIELWSWWWLYSVTFSPPFHCQWPKMHLPATQWHSMQTQWFSVRQNESIMLTWLLLLNRDIGKYTSEHSNLAAMKKFKANESVKLTRLLLSNRELQLESMLPGKVIWLWWRSSRKTKANKKKS